MSDRHPDAHWTCATCGVWLVRGWSNARHEWSYTNSDNGEQRCRRPSAPMYPPAKDAPLHLPYIPDLSTIESVEEYLAR